MENPQHFVYDFAGVNPLILASKESMRLVIASIVRKTGMTPVGEPVLELMTDPDNPVNCGVTGVQIIKESLIDLHSYGESGHIYISVFSCRPFDPVVIYETLCELLGSRDGYLKGVKRRSLSDRPRYTTC